LHDIFTPTIVLYEVFNPEFAIGRGRRRKILEHFCPELLNRTAGGTLSSLGTKVSASFFVFGLTPIAKSGFKKIRKESSLTYAEQLTAQIYKTELSSSFFVFGLTPNAKSGLNMTFPWRIPLSMRQLNCAIAKGSP